MRGVGVVCKTPARFVHSRSQHCAGRRLLQVAVRVTTEPRTPKLLLVRFLVVSLETAAAAQRSTEHAETAFRTDNDSSTSGRQDGSSAEDVEV